MSKTTFPADWDEKKVRRVIAHYEEQTQEDALAEDHELMPKVCELTAKRQG